MEDFSRRHEESEIALHNEHELKIIVDHQTQTNSGSEGSGTVEFNEDKFYGNTRVAKVII
jgi:hypothetical protein